MPSPPSVRAAWERLIAANPPEWVLPHSRAVEALAGAMFQCALKAGLEADGAVIASGALLHDVGRSVTQDIRHASLGADLLRAEGWDERVVRCVERHTGAGIDAAEAAALGLPARQYIPQTLEERIVAHADNLYSGHQRLTLAKAVAKYEAKGLFAASRRIIAMHARLEAELGVELEGLRANPMPVFTPG